MLNHLDRKKNYILYRTHQSWHYKSANRSWFVKYSVKNDQNIIKITYWVYLKFREWFVCSVSKKEIHLIDGAWLHIFKLAVCHVFLCSRWVVYFHVHDVSLVFTLTICHVLPRVRCVSTCILNTYLRIRIRIRIFYECNNIRYLVNVKTRIFSLVWKYVSTRFFFLFIIMRD